MANNSRRKFFISLVRHGETELNRKGLIQGQGFDATLNGTGRAQAKALGQRLCNESFTLAYSSDQARARETCELILSENLPGCAGTGAGLKNIVKDIRIRERCYGIMEGRTREDFEQLAKSFGMTRADFLPDGAETISDLGDRAELFFLSLCKQCLQLMVNKSSAIIDDDVVVPSILVVAHGRLIATLLSRLSERYGCSFPPGKLASVPQNTAISNFEITLSKQLIETFSKSNVSGDILPNMVNVKCTSLNSADHLARLGQQ